MSSLFPHPAVFFPCIALIGLLSSDMTTQTARAEDSEAAVKQIRERYQVIEAAKLRPQEITFASETDPLTGSLTRYFLGDELVKIKLVYVLGDHSEREAYFYYDSGALVFVFATDTVWKFSGELLPSGDSGTIDRAVQHRLYFDKNVLVRHLSREAVSKDPKRIATLLNSASNRPGTDSERAGQLARLGRDLYRVRDEDAVMRLILQ